MVGAVRDLTESKRADEERQNLERRMQETQRMESLGDGLPNPSVRAFAVHPLNAQRILVRGGRLQSRGSDRSRS